MRIFIVAIGSFLGSRLAAHLQQGGHSISGTSRSPVAKANCPVVRYSLGDPFDASTVADCDVVIHTAHDFSNSRRTVEGSAILFRSVLQLPPPIPRQIFISSYSACADAVSNYGSAKYEIEQMFLRGGEAIVRPGLVIGNGGMFGRNLQSILGSPVVPLLDGGHDVVPVIGVSDFLVSMERLITEGSTGAWNLFHPVLPGMRELVVSILEQSGHRAILLPVPSVVALFTIRTARRLGLRLPFEEDNIRSLKSNQLQMYESDLPQLCFPMPLREMVCQALAERRVF